MKITLVGELTQEKEIDWSKPMMVSNKENETIILTNGVEDDVYFQGIVLFSYSYKIGCREDWKKSFFKPLTTPITITFQND